ncbi:MAG: hypothetical protein ABI237_01105 [Ginsengibacter sp.]
MKKILFVLGLCTFLFACNQGSDKTTTDESSNHVHDEDVALTLNNGAKWKADTMTNRHLVAIKTMANMFKVAPFPAAEKYQILGSDLQAGFNSMIKDCTLKGAPDEALHKWMLPILRQAQELKNITDTAKARPIFDSLDQRINIYYDYFE